MFDLALSHNFLEIWQHPTMVSTKSHIQNLTLLQQGKEEEAEVFIGNNTRQRDGKSMVAGMLQEHLQKIANVTLEQTPSQATELLEAEPQN